MTATVLLLAAAVVALAGLLALPALVQRPRLVLALLTIMIVSNGQTVLAGLGIPRVHYAALALAIVTAAVGIARRTLSLRPSVVFAVALAWLAVRVLSVVVAGGSTDALAILASDVVALAFLPVVVALCSAPGGLRTVMAAAAMTLLGLAALSLANELLAGGSASFGGFSRTIDDPGASADGRHSGPYGDPNYWGRVLALLAPMAVLAAARRGGWAARSSVAAALAVLAGALVLSGSRGSLLAVLAALGLTAWLQWSRKPAAALAAAALVGVAVIGAVRPALSALESLQLAARGGGDPSIVGRLGALQYGIDMVLEQPVLGVGLGRFVEVAPEYQRRDGFVFGEALAPHNLYLEAAAETGFTGLLAWLAIVAAVVMVAARARARARARFALLSDGDTSRRAGDAVLAGVAGWSAASLFLHLSHLMVFVLVAALAVALDQEPRTGESHPVVHPRRAGDVRTVDPERGPAVRANIRRVAVCSVVPLLVAMIAWLGLEPLRATWQAEGSAIVAHVDGAETDPYNTSLGTRRIVVESLAAVAQGSNSGPGSTVQAVAEASPTGNLIRMSVRANDPVLASLDLDDALQSARTAVEELDTPFAIRTRQIPTRVDQVTVVDPDRLSVVVGTAVVTWWGCLLVTAGSRSRRLAGSG